MQPSEALSDYRTKYPVKPMRIEPANPDQMILMTAVDGLFDMPPAPASGPQITRPASLPDNREKAPDARYLWAIRPTDVPVALEQCEWSNRLQDRKIKHSNLTGGKFAHSAGEIWFIADDRIAVNANSGRYGAESNEEFQQIVDALRKCGFYVASMGFDIDNKSRPNSIFVGEPEWQPPT
jgi:hypothetical protein